MITGVNFSSPSILYFKLHKINFFCTQFLKCSLSLQSFSLKKKKFPNKEFVAVLELHFWDSYGRSFLLYGHM